MEKLTIWQLAQRLQVSKQFHFTGRLSVSTEQGQEWDFFFRFGRLVWATGGNHRFRRWRRALQAVCPDGISHSLPATVNPISPVWEYQTLTMLAKRQLLRREQAIALIEQVVLELLFDMAQESMATGLVMQVHTTSSDLGELLVILNIEQLFQQAIAQWNAWVNADLARYSPNLAPLLPASEQTALAQSPLASQNLDGQSTLRDLAIATQMELPTLTRFLVGYLNQGRLQFQEIPDLWVEHPPAPVHPSPTESDRPLILCVDDSHAVCQTMEQILTAASYTGITVQDPLQALPTILEYKPDLIFLDLVMPGVKGLTICAQLRRIAVFKETPVIILTEQDKLVDRLRAKLAGASGFLLKPLEASKVLEIVSSIL